MISNMSDVSVRPRNTNFSIAALISENKEDIIKTEEDEDIAADDSDEEELEVGTEANDDTAETSLETEEKVSPSVVKKEKKVKVLTGKTNCTDLDHVKCSLENKDLWDKFCEFGTEMIITRSGRRMFPTVRCSFSNLDLEPGVRYLILLDIVPCDNKRYRYAYHRSSWLVAGKADPAPPVRLHAHPDGPFTADQLKKQVIGFEKVKISTQVLATACNSEISLKNPFQQIQSSFVMNWTSISEPANVLSSTASWFAPIRSGPHWIDSYWIQIDFLTIMRLTKFQLKQPDLYRVVTIARLN